MEVRKESAMEVATFGAGCFWGVEDLFRTLPGVMATTVGYAGGTMENPTYENVCRGDTGHAEVVRVEYDPSAVSYEQLLDTFWNGHDPTQRNRQGPDVGEQYRSVIFTHTPDQERLARMSKESLEHLGKYGGRTIATEIVPAESFSRAEEYHQKYNVKRGMSSE